MKRTRPDYGGLLTEAVHPRAASLETRPIDEIVELLLREEGNAQRAALACKAQIARAAELVVAALSAGGRLVYVGAGTSGRLGALDAAELPPTFGSQRSQVLAVLAGGPRAMLRSAEGAEDRPHTAQARLSRLGLSAADVVCAIAASGVTPFSRAALRFARERGARTIFVTCVPQKGGALADVLIAATVGPEVLAGSTRLKAGTATKIILNAISTASMVKLGKVYRGRMVDVLATNQKLKARAKRIVRELTGVTERTAESLLRHASGRPKLAIAMEELGVNAAEAARQLDEAGGDLHRLFAGRAKLRRSAGGMNAKKKGRRR